jgi:glycerophosphoryl diester phosphodiesterase
MKNVLPLAACVALLCIVSTAISAPPLHTLNISSPAELKQFFHYEQGSAPIVSAHRGGLAKGYPENCLSTFEHLLEHTHALIEVDPRFTKDGQIVLMHDATLDRTTNGTGKVAAHSTKSAPLN